MKTLPLNTPSKITNNKICFNKDEKNNYATNSSSINILNNIDKTLCNETPTGKKLKPVNEDVFQSKPNLDFYKAYCEELEKTIDELMEKLNVKTDKLMEMENIKTESLELKRKLKAYNKIMSLSRTDENFCEVEVCLANKLKLEEMKYKYDKILKEKNSEKLNNLLYD